MIGGRSPDGVLIPFRFVSRLYLDFIVTVSKVIHTINCPCHSRESVFRVLGMYSLFNDITRDFIANNFVIDVYCRCLQILY